MDILADLTEEPPERLPDDAWQLHDILFARVGRQAAV
jgi:hypothetical protein